MKYRINEYGDLVIINDSCKPIFVISKYKDWFKYDYDHNANRLYYEDYRGLKQNYNDGI